MSKFMSSANRSCLKSLPMDFPTRNHASSYRWTADGPRELRITVGHQVLTTRRYNGQESGHCTVPRSLLDWLLGQWPSILHEEAFAA